MRVKTSIALASLSAFAVVAVGGVVAGSVTADGAYKKLGKAVVATTGLTPDAYKKLGKAVVGPAAAFKALGK